MVFGDSDGLPGLTVDKFGDYLCLQIVSLGMETWKGVLTELLADLFSPKGIYERNDVPVREKEGLPQITGCLYGAVPGLVPSGSTTRKCWRTCAVGRKRATSWISRKTEAAFGPIVPEPVFWTCAATPAAFPSTPALYGAASVEAVDVSRDALEMLTRNAACNGVANSITTTCANVFQSGKDYSEAGKQYDLVICDPPAFAKSKSAPSGRLPGDIKSSTCGASGWSAPADTWPPGLAVSL